jgi:LuxR family transcriptional regulator, maltose regulon positive regulatory protein
VGRSACQQVKSWARRDRRATPCSRPEARPRCCASWRYADAVGDLPGAAALLDEAGELVQQLTDPGVLPALVDRAQRSLRTAPRRQGQIAAPLTVRELAVLRLLPTQLSTREIGRELSVSVNTVRSQIQAIYRKLGVSSRSEAVTHARELGLLPTP